MPIYERRTVDHSRNRVQAGGGPGAGTSGETGQGRQAAEKVGYYGYCVDDDPKE